MATTVFQATTRSDAVVLMERLLDRGVSVDLVPAHGQPGYATTVTGHDPDGRLDETTIAEVTEYLSVRVEENHGT